MAAVSHSVGSASHSVPANVRSVVAAVRSVALETNSVTCESHWAVPQRHWMAANGDSPAAEDEFLKTRSCGRHPEAGWRQKNSAADCAVGETSEYPQFLQGLRIALLRKRGWVSSLLAEMFNLLPRTCRKIVRPRATRRLSRQRAAFQSDTLQKFFPCSRWFSVQLSCSASNTDESSKKRRKPFEKCRQPVRGCAPSPNRVKRSAHTWRLNRR